MPPVAPCRRRGIHGGRASAAPPAALTPSPGAALLRQGLLLLAVDPAAGYVKNCTHGSSAAFNPATCNCTRWCDPVGGVPHGYSASLPNVYGSPLPCPLPCWVSARQP